MSAGLSTMSMNFEVLGKQTIKFEVSYWPDKSDESGMARLIVREDKITGWRW
ncbi:MULTISPECIES: hypothetical protein [unclassified Pseudomonas]|uniref:hypothetical protein n=1 Tax=unclassified Pseudomonas TaxID=196821 RepID=UPI0021CA31B6|nr:MULTISPECIES: hypothetical protein [unclassified Pseudomonas]MCU1732955.1 hypothetical protein [Pseudomonas sp. 20P_3.2_Bac4]MCU1744053.1 hypothetical protein [Pseudomonas sp. 20P_3.2_Bac5]